MMVVEKANTIAANLQIVDERIKAACARVGRAPEEVSLVAVSKTRSIAEIVEAYRCGARDFGENRVEEAGTKVPQLRQEFADDPATWHMIGHVQSRKAKQAVALSDIIHSVDSLRLARRLERFAAEMEKSVPVLLEINVSGEPNKYGFPAWDRATSQQLIEEARLLEPLAHLVVQGLMTMAPIVANPEEARPVFRRLREVRDLLRERCAFATWTELSMGMTDDYEVAIEEGATIVRIGRAIFGPRDQ